MNANKTKRYACPHCGNRLRLRDMFGMKKTVTCRGCGRELKVKKRGLSFMELLSIAGVSITVIVLGNILRMSGVSFIHTMLILSGLGLVVISIACLVDDLFSDFE